MVNITAKSSFLKNYCLHFSKNFYTIIVHYVINFVFSIGKQPYGEVVNFVRIVSYVGLHVVYIVIMI